MLDKASQAIGSGSPRITDLVGAETGIIKHVRAHGNMVIGNNSSCMVYLEPMDTPIFRCFYLNGSILFPRGPGARRESKDAT